MLSPEMYLQLAHERMAADAEAARRWRVAREATPRPEAPPPPVEEARLAKAGPAQRGALLTFLTGLSARTVYRRFFTPRVRWSEQDLDRLLPGDGRGEAVVALWHDQVVGHALATPGPEGSLDLAVVVADDWQGLGLGSRLVGELLAGELLAGGDRPVDIEFDIQAGNRPAANLARRLWPGATAAFDGPFVHYRVTPARAEEPCPA